MKSTKKDKKRNIVLLQNSWIQDLYQGEEDYTFKSTATIGKHSVVYLGRLK